jgi:sugar-specific transcriptional regulator TrmB
MDITKKLQKSGLTEKEAIVYNYLVAHGGASPSMIAENTKLNRTTIYTILNRLCIQGLVSEIKKGNKKFFQAEKAERLINAAQYKVKLAEDARRQAENTVPMLKELLAKVKHKPKVQFYNTHDSVIAAYMEHVDIGHKYKMKAFFSPANLKNFLPIKKFRYYIKEKERLGITVKAIASESDYAAKFNIDMFTGIKREIWPEIRTVKGSVFPFPGEITLYDKQKVSIIKFDPTHPVAVIIDDKDMYTMINSIFELVWVNAEEM